jgi:NADH dehydrogenase FAD-containing subunit
MLDSTIRVRRSVREDIASLHGPITSSRFIYEKRFGTFNLFSLIERSFICVTAVLEGSEAIVGMAAFSGAPTGHGSIDEKSWERWFNSFAKKDVICAPSNTLWMNFFFAEVDSQHTILHNMLTTVFATLPFVDSILMGLEASAPPFSPVKDIFTPISVTQEAEAVGLWKGTVLRTRRSDIIPDLIVRIGVVEDYDDLMPMLIAGEGVLTPLNDKFYLDELLERQDEYHSVLVALDPTNNGIVGLMCLSAATEDQQHVTKKYNTDAYNNLKHMIPPKKQGASPAHNLVRIDFFYLHPSYENRATCFLPRLYETFPFAEYSYIQLPHATPEHALLHDYNYIPIRKFMPMGHGGERLTLLEGLWLGCRYSNDTLKVMPASEVHEAGITRTLGNQGELTRDETELMTATIKESLAAQVSSEMEAGKSYPLVMIWGDQVAGVISVRSLDVEELHAFRTNFDMDAFTNFNPDGEANYGVINIALGPEEAQRTHWKAFMPALLIEHIYVRSVFRCRVRFFLREVLRLTSRQLLLYVAGASTETFTPLLAELNLVMPRQVPEVPTDKATKATEEGLLCLHMQSMRGLSDEKTRINARIVVVGASTTGLSFLYHLLSIPYLHFTNLVLLSRDALPDHPNHQEMCWTMDTMDWIERQYMILKVGRKIRVIEATLMDFDRTDQYIMPDSGLCEPYDYLIISTGREYAVPKELQVQKNGIFALNGNKAIKKIKQHIHESEIYEDDLSSVVVYGSSLDTYAVVNCLVELGLAAQRIVIVSPENTSTSETSIFGDALVDMKVDKLMESMGIKTHKYHELEHEDYDEDNNLSMVSIISRSDVATSTEEQRRKKAIEIPATLFVWLHEKDIDTHILSALNKRSIVFDGRVIIEQNYRTTDPNIYAAGPIAMFSRRFGRSNDFERYSALEVGRKLCETVLGFMGIEEYYVPEDEDELNDSSKQLNNPLAAELDGGTTKTEQAETHQADVPQRGPPKPLPQYEHNISKRVTLPMGYLYLQFHTAAFPDIAAKCTHLSSSNIKGSQYIRLSISPNKFIECVTYFGNEDVEVFNLQSLVGMPESQLNLLYNYHLSRNEKGDATLDLLAFLRQSWAKALFYDRYRGLYANTRDTISQHPDVIKLKESMMDYIVRAGIDRISDKDRVSFMQRITHEHSDVRHTIELALIKFMHENKEYMPQIYFLPDVSEHVRLTQPSE